jgi:hypothetical protein
MKCENVNFMLTKSWCEKAKERLDSHYNYITKLN